MDRDIKVVLWWTAAAAACGVISVAATFMYAYEHRLRSEAPLAHHGLSQAIDFHLTAQVLAVVAVIAYVLSYTSRRRCTRPNWVVSIQAVAGLAVIAAPMMALAQF